MINKAITQAEIARRLGVSVATISRVVNDQPGVGDVLRQKVLRTLQELQYAPNASARSLVTDETCIVGFVTPEPSAMAAADPFYMTIMAGAEAELARHGYHMILTTLDEQPASRPEVLPVVQKGRVDGLILAGPKIPKPLIFSLLAADVPVVLVDNCLSQVPVNCILGDNEDGLYQATRHILDHGHRTVAFLSGPQGWVSNREREEGYRRAMGKAGLEPRVINGDETTIASGQAMLAEALQRWPELTAICAVNDPVAIGAIRAAQQLGRAIPGDLALIGFDDISWAALNSPALSTVHVFKRRMGQLAARRLVELLQEPAVIPSRTIVATQLVIRESCGSH